MSLQANPSELWFAVRNEEYFTGPISVYLIMDSSYENLRLYSTSGLKHY
jgi:hypothetical protein